MSIFFLVLHRMSDTGKKIPNNNDQIEENANFGHFMPFLTRFVLLRPRYKCWGVQMSMFFLVLPGMSEIGKKIPNNNNQFEENADFGHLRPFLTCFWPVMAPVWVFKVLMILFFLVLSGMSEIGIRSDCRKCQFWPFYAIFGLFFACYGPGVSVERSKWVYFS